VEVKTCPDTGNEEIRVGASKIDNSIRFIYQPRETVVKVVANTAIGYVSAKLTKSVELKTAPWSGGLILVTDNGINISLEESDYEEVGEWLESHGVTILVTASESN